MVLAMRQVWKATDAHKQEQSIVGLESFPEEAIFKL